jgi:HAD superfamily hydrolase (TIGR01509 family)
VGKELAMKSVRVVLLDIDGTLVDSNDAHARAWVETLAEFDRPANLERVRELIGKGGDKLLPELTGIPIESILGETIKARRKARFQRDYLPSLRPFPGARELLERMRADGLRLVVATSADEEEMRGLVKVAEAEDLLDEQTSSSDAKNSKPDPDIVRAALGRAEARPEEALMLGDTPYDVEASTRAGVRVIAVRSGGWNDQNLTGAIAIYDDVADLLAHYESSPFAA